LSNKENKGKIKILKNGPYLVSGSIPLSEKIIVAKGKGFEYQSGRELPQAEEYALCRCGQSKNPPFCDGSHGQINFDGTETASREKYVDRAKLKEGPGLNLLDDNRCARVRFCYREEGKVWSLMDRSADPHFRNEAIQGACNCPAGRLVALDQNGNPIELEHEPAIEILQDPCKEVSGPIFVKGNIPVESADGFPYEVRNRITLCRCGASSNKPFCDAAHISIKYIDDN